MKQTTKDLLNSALKIPFKFIPLGGIFDEVFFGYAGKIKQGRLNRFTSMLIDRFETVGFNMDSEKIQTEEFVDLFESIILKVVKTSSEEKLKIYRNILLNQIEHTSENTDKTSIYLDLLDQLSDVELRVLKLHYDYTAAYAILHAKLQKNNEKGMQFRQRFALELMSPDKFSNLNLNRKLSEMDHVSNNLLKQMEVLQDKTGHFNLDMEEADFMFYKQSLWSKGLLVDGGVGTHGHLPFKNMETTELASQFMNFIVNSEQSEN